MQRVSIKKFRIRMIFNRCLFAGLIAVTQSACASRYDLCDTSGFEMVESGWVQVRDVGGVSYLDFITSKNKLEKDGIPLDSTSVMDVARDVAVQEIYRFYMRKTPQPFPKADLSYSQLESFASECLSDTHYGFRVPISALSWIKPNLTEDDPSMGPVKELLQKHGLE